MFIDDKMDIKQIIKSLDMPKPKNKQCYKNSQMVSIASNGLIDYYEGYVDGIPHAWNKYKGEIIDTTPTYKRKKGKGYTEEKGFSLQEIKENINKTNGFRRLSK